MIYRNLQVLQKDLLSGNTTCERVVRDFFLQIEEKKELNAFVEVFEKSAILQAQKVDAKIADNIELGKLFGLVIGIKDNISYKGHTLTAGSKILQNYTAPYNATVIDRLLQEDAIILGRLNCDEFAMGSSNEHSCYGSVKNPHDLSRVSGGSSGGSAAAVAAGLCMASLGSDTGGSIRQPASFCGVLGLKPTYGRVSRYGLVAYGSSFDQIGPICNDSNTAARILECIAGIDIQDATTSHHQMEAYSTTPIDNKKLNIAYYSYGTDHPSVDTSVRKATKDCIAKLQALGHTLTPIELPELEYAVPAYYVLTTAEASSNLSRFDGIRYGHTARSAENLDELYKKSRAEGFGWEVQRRIMSGTFVLSTGYYDAYYAKAQKIRRIIAEKTHSLLATYDFILCPTAPSVAFRFGENSNDAIAMYLADIFTVQANLAGIPALSIPYSMDAETQMPIGMQFMSAKFSEKKLLDLAAYLEENI